MNRRFFLQALPWVATSTTTLANRQATAAEAPASAPSPLKMTACLVPGSIGVQADQRETLELAARHGFGAIEPFPDYLAGLDPGSLETLLARLKERGLAFGAAGLPVDFRGSDESFQRDLDRLSPIAKTLERTGVTRIGTWLSPTHASLPYLQNFRRHASRLRAVAERLKDHGLRLGLEYVGTKTSRTRFRYSFIHTLAELQDLIREIGTGNVGVVLDSWHWWQAEDTEADLLALRSEEIVSVDLNDAPAGVPKEQQKDNQRELPAATGVIDVATFLRALDRIGYDGPVGAEPFNRALNQLDNDAACAAAIAALRKSFATVR